MHKRMQRFLRETKGATAIEYALIASLVSVVILTAVTLLGTNLGGVYTIIAGSF